jgi:hypothetical protein
MKPDRKAHNDKKAVALLSADHIHLGITIGDRSVSMCLAHVDSSHHLLSLREKTVRLPTGRGCTPSMPQIQAALRECWDGLGGESIEYHHCFLCLPPWATAWLEASASVRIRAAHWRLDRARPRVSDADILRAQQALCARQIPASRVVVRVLPRHYVLDDGRRVSDPRGEITPGFELHGRLELADAGIARNLLDLLDAMRLRVDLMVSPTGAVEALLRGQEDADDVLIDVGQRTTGFSFRQDGVTVHDALLPRGSDEVLAHTAERLHTGSRNLAACFESQGGWLSEPQAYGGRPLALWPVPFDSAFTVRQVHEALLRETNAHFQGISEVLETARRERGLRSDRVLLVGDDPVVTDALLRVASSMAPGRCQLLHSPWQKTGQEEPPTPGRARMAGLLLLGGLETTPAYQPFLASYNRTPSDPAIRILAEDGRVALGQLATGWRNRVLPSARRALLRIAALFM